jgi:hypothetical protein
VEEIIIILIQFLVEVIGQALIQIPFDCTIRQRDESNDQPIVIAFAALCLGGLVGWFSLMLLPGTLIHSQTLRVINMFVTPFVGGAIGYFIAKWQYRTRNPDLIPSYHFWYAFFFSLGLAAIRLAYHTPHH